MSRWVYRRPPQITLYVRRPSAAFLTVADENAEGTGAQILPALTQEASGGVEISGAGAQTLPALDQAGVGGAPAISGIGEQVLPSLEQAGSGGVAIAGDGAQELPPLEQSGSGGVEISGAGEQTLPGLTQDGSGGLAIAGDGEQTLPPLEQIASGSADDAIVGQGAQTLPSLEQAGQGDVAISIAGAGEQTLPPLTQGGSGDGGEEMAPPYQGEPARVPGGRPRQVERKRQVRPGQFGRQVRHLGAPGGEPDAPVQVRPRKPATRIVYPEPDPAPPAPLFPDDSDRRAALAALVDDVMAEHQAALLAREELYAKLAERRAARAAMIEQDNLTVLLLVA